MKYKLLIFSLVCFILATPKQVNAQLTQLGTNIIKAPLSSTDQTQIGTEVASSADGMITALGSSFTTSAGGWAGIVRVYRFNPDINDWEQLGSDLLGTARGQRFGYTLDLSDDGYTLAVSSRTFIGFGNSTPKVGIYKFINNDWVLMGNEINAEKIDDYFGNNLALNADGTVVVIQANPNQVGDLKYAKIYEYNGNDWVQKGNRLKAASLSHNWGGLRGLDINDNGDVIIISNYDYSGTTAIGSVILFKYNANTNKWDLKDEVINNVSLETFGDAISYASTAMDTIIAIGAPRNILRSDGYVRVYKFENDKFVQLGNQIDGERTNRAFGTMVSLSGDGKTLLVGRGIPETNRGLPELYRFENNIWTKYDENLFYDENNSTGVFTDGLDYRVAYHGKPLSLSKDGTVITVGVPYGKMGTTEVGLAKVFTIDLDLDDDGIVNSVESSQSINGGDTDGDGIVNMFDLDSDNDGIPDVVEAGGTDENRDGIADGIPGRTATTLGIPASAGTGLTPPNSDGEGPQDYVDLDSDDDGVPDIFEGGLFEASLVDLNEDGLVDTTSVSDLDGDGIQLGVDGSTNKGGAYDTTVLDLDKDNIADYVDLDSDDSNNIIGNGDDDIVKNGNSSHDADLDGRLDDKTDVDYDGILDIIDKDNNVFGGVSLPSFDFIPRVMVEPTIVTQDSTEVYFIIRIRELNQVTAQSDVVIGLTETDLIEMNFDNELEQLGVYRLDNEDWEYLGKENSIHKFKNSSITKGATSVIGIKGLVASIGLDTYKIPLNISVDSSSGIEKNITNNSDSELIIIKK